MASTRILKIENIQKSFTNPEGQQLLVLEDISFQLNEKEIVVLIGKSGSGKSTLLRLIAGLSKPTKGDIFFQGNKVFKPHYGISMVFQNAALFPWLNVFENVEIGLEAQNVPKDIRREKVLKAIDTIGMDGFESAYPKELSGGMRQRVGFARALVMEPELLLMDESFSSLDILTAENLRNDLLSVWSAEKTRTKSVLCVTHNIEEAILMANRILIISSDPGRIQKEFIIDHPFPRNSASPALRELVDQIYYEMSLNEKNRLRQLKEQKSVGLKSPYAYRLPDVAISELTGFLETIESLEIDGKIDLPMVAENLHLDVDDLFPLMEVLEMMQMAKVQNGDLYILEAGKYFAQADIQERKQLFAKHLINHIPLAKHVRELLDTKPNNRMSKAVLIEELQNYLTYNEAQRLLNLIIDWGRYAEIFAYDYDTDTLSLENP